MISEAARSASNQCFVYVMLPATASFVPAGRFEHTIDRHGVATGRFVYGKRYLARPDAVPLDPIDLKLADRVYETRQLEGMFGAIRDASPDYWGRRVIERFAGIGGRLPELDYLLHSPDDRAGALGFGRNVDPPAPRRAYNRTLDLARLQALADAIVADEEVPHGIETDQAQALLLNGTSMGGARPKAVLEDGEALWIAKFNRRDDRWNCARVEHAMLRLAREAGIQSAESRVVQIGDRDVLLVKRFDRRFSQEGYHRARMLSALTLLRAGEMPDDRARWSYVLLAEELRRISARPQEDARELFRRMCFNALISNMDDHPRNHAVITLDHEWRLSPAYDLTPSAPVAIERRDLAMECGDMGRYAHVANVVSQAPRFLLTPDEARRVADEMEALVRSHWYAVARSAGVSEADCAKIAGSFAYKGFRLALPSG